MKSKTKQTLAIANAFGNVDVRGSLSKRYQHIRGKRIGPLCLRLGIAYAPALIDFERFRGGYKPIIDGVVVSKASVERVRTAIKERAEKRKSLTPAQRKKIKQQRKRARKRRQERDIERFTGDILAAYPLCPPDEAKSIATHACEIGSGRVGRSRIADDPVTAAVVAHIRHRHTNYDELLDAAADDGESRFYARQVARQSVASDIRRVIDDWSREPD